MTTAGAVAEFLGVSCSPAIKDRKISGVADAQKAEDGSVCFAMDADSLQAALRGCGLVLASADCEFDDPRVLRVGSPRVAFSRVYQRFFSFAENSGVHPTAVVEEDVQLGSGCCIGPRVVVGRGCKIGRDCRLDAGAVLYAGTVLGDRVAVQAGAVLGSAGFGYVQEESGKYLAFPQIGRLVIEDDVEIGANTTIDRGALGETRIGRGTKIDNLVHIGHNCGVGEDVVIAAQTGLSGSVVIENKAVIGGQVGIGDHATIGAGVILGSGSGVLTGKKLRGPGQVFWGIPAHPLKQYLRDLARFRRG